MADIERIERDLRENLASFDAEVAFELANDGERADLWTDIDVPAEAIRALLDELAWRAEIIERAKEVIRPYADVANFYDHDPDDRDSEEMGDDQLAFMHQFKLGRLRSARAFLSILEPTHAE